MTDREPVLVTGASGYIALHLIRQLLDAGERVRGTLRNLDRAAELRAALGEPDEDRLSFVVADLTADAGWEEAVAGCPRIAHTASPVPLRQPDDPEALVATARDGALRLLRAACAAGAKRVVLTSSVAAIYAGDPPPASGERYSEANWSDLDRPMSAYARSKTVAERAAWDLIAGQPADSRPELVTINPSLVLGPPLAGDFSPSVEIVRRLVAREVPGCPRLGFTLVDVRDVAAAHRLALDEPKAAGNRYICANEFRWTRDIALVLAEHLTGSGRRIPTRPLPDWLVRIVGLFDPTIRMITPDLGKRKQFDNSAIRRDLGWQPRPLEQTIADCADGLIERGLA